MHTGAGHWAYWGKDSQGPFVPLLCRLEDKTDIHLIMNIYSITCCVRGSRAPMGAWLQVTLLKPLGEVPKGPKMSKRSPVQSGGWGGSRLWAVCYLSSNLRTIIFFYISSYPTLDFPFTIQIIIVHAEKNSIHSCSRAVQ